MFEKEKIIFRYLILFGIFFIGFSSCKTVKLSRAEELHRRGEYYEASQMYRKLYRSASPKERVKRGFLAYRMGECERKVKRNSRAMVNYRNAIRYEYPDSIIYLRLAQMLHSEGDYKEAIANYKLYLESKPQSEIALNGIKGCELAVLWKDLPTKYESKKESFFNSRRSDFCPMLLPPDYDVLYFNSTRKQSDKEREISPITGMFTNDIFMSRKDEQGKWLRPEVSAGGVNTEFDEGTVSFTLDGSAMYYSYAERNDEHDATVEIYRSSRSGGDWGPGTKVSILKDSTILFAHPAVSPDGKFLYFASDMPGGYGGLDLWRAFLHGDHVGAMENLGSEINTAGDEVYPFVRDSVTFYFASDGHPGMGGLDLFCAKLDTLKHWNVENMKPPFNSEGDDFGITFRGDEESGYFSSNRGDAKGWDHIFSFIRPQVTVKISGYVTDNEDYVIPNAVVQIVGRNGLNEKVFVKNDGSYEVELDRNVSYVMMAGAPDYLNQKFELHTDPEERDETYYVDFFLSSRIKPVVVENIFYDFDQASLRSESKEALDGIVRVLKDNPEVIIEMGAHTDRKGSEQYNEGLAQRRAESVVNYLIAQGIPSERLKAKGYGKMAPKIVSKRMAEKQDFLEEGMVLTAEFIETLEPEKQEICDQYNRRTEFKVIDTRFEENK